MSAKFAVGEKAELVYCRNLLGSALPGWEPGIIVTISSINPIPYRGVHADYSVSWPGKPNDRLDGYVLENQLRKLPGDSKQDFIPPEVRKLFTPKELTNA